MYDNAAFVLEGGGMRGVFTCGIIDALIERDVNIDYVCAVSAGVTSGINYVSKQYGRGKFLNVDALIKYKYLSPRFYFTKQRGMMNMDFLFGELAFDICPLDFETYRNSGKRFLLPVIHAKTGKTVWLEEYDDVERLTLYCRATCSLPFFMPPVTIDGEEYYDGGVCASIPYKKALEDGKKKLVIVLTKPVGYVRKKERVPGLFKYPIVKRLLENRADGYNRDLAYLEDLERKGQAFILRPSGKYNVGRMERDESKLLSLYEEGLSIGRERMDELIAFLEK